MRLVRLKSLSALLAASAGLVSCAPQQPPRAPGPPTTHRVNLAVACSGDSVSFTLSPWSLSVVRDDAIEWHLTVTTGRVPEFGVERVRGGKWLFIKTARITGNPQNPARAQEMAPKAANGLYRYKVDLTCEDAVTGRLHNVVVDPDIWLN